MTVRLQVNLADDTAAFLRARAATEGRSITEIVRRMASVYQFVTSEIDEKGNRILVESRTTGDCKEVTLL